jgi:hypothetical protein
MEDGGPYQNPEALIGEDEAAHLAAPEALFVEETALDKVVSVVALDPVVAREVLVEERGGAAEGIGALASVCVEVGTLERLEEGESQVSKR